MQLTQRQQVIVDWLIANPDSKISGIKKWMGEQVSIPTLNRDLKDLVDGGVVARSGGGRNITYQVMPAYQLLNEKMGDSYFEKEVDQRQGNQRFVPDLFNLLEKIPLFTEGELAQLKALHAVYLDKVKHTSPTLLQKETERLIIELSWKSSQIEGNTYSLLETELLLSERLLAKGKDPSEATMLLNHKEALEYLFDHRISLNPLKVSAVEDIHSLLTQGLGVSKNLRKRAVGITGTTYTPPDNEFQIKEYLENACTLINQRPSVFEKALLAVLFISYIQPFEDGNKRTARITANGLLIENGYCPLSYRSVEPLEYKKAMILFYEQNNIAVFKKIFMGQFAFAVNHYF